MLDFHDIPEDTRTQVSDTARREYVELVSESRNRRMEALRLYQPTEIQNKYHTCTAKECLFQAGNQVGKSLAHYVEIARAVTGQDPYNKYPKTDGVCICVCYDEQNIGTNLHTYLFKGGRFRIIKDSETKEWRTFHPVNDAARVAESRPAPPLIPKRFIKRIAWLKKNKNVFQEVEFTTGWVMFARTSKGQPLQSIQADLAGIDEDLEKADWYEELIARLTIRKGKLRWNALPLAKNDALIKLVERAEDEAGKKDEHGNPVPPDTVVIRARVFDNPYMDEEERQRNIRIWKSKGNDEYRKRALGELTTDSRLMYPSFDISLHGAMLDSLDGTETALQKILFECKGVPPKDWCRYMSVDPGHGVCAVTFYAVPPEDVSDQVVCYDELYIIKNDMDIFGRRVHDKTAGDCFQAFIIDMHGGKLRSVAGGDPPHRQYTGALAKHNIRSVATGSNFLHGSDDKVGREMLVREWLRLRENGTPRLLIHLDNCPNLVRELRRFKKKIVGDIVTEDGDRRETHAVETLEYAVAHGLRFVKQPQTAVRETLVARVRNDERRRFVRRMKEQLFAGDFAGVNLGPQGTPY